MPAATPDPSGPVLGLSEILGALSHALDLTEGQPQGHCVRCCWIGVRAGTAMGLGPDELKAIYYTTLLKDLGCSSNAARICQLYLTDDIGFKHDYKLIGDGLPRALRFVVDHTGAEAGIGARLRAILNIVRNGGEIAQELIETRCRRGAAIARRLRFKEEVAGGVHGLDEHWDGRGRPEGLAGAAIPLAARVALLAQVVDVVHAAEGEAAARAEARARAGTWFDPAVVAGFERAAGDPEFWAGLRAGDLAARVFALEPALQGLPVDPDYLDDIAGAFAEVIDSKSPYTRGHSDRVALYADLIAGELDLGEAHRRRLRRAALLHDLGKLGVSNAILDKPGRLDADEFDAVKRHPVHGRTILARLGAYPELARVAGDHHERLDGRGYPRGLTAEALDLDTRIVTVADVFDALTAERPYRAALPLAEVVAIMTRDLGTAFDPDCFAALISAVRAGADMARAA